MDEFEKIGQEAVAAADMVNCSLEECLEGYRTILGEIQQRIECIVAEIGD